jgi:phage internal scaffolding protein
MTEEKRKRVQVKFTLPSMTKQSFKKDCDVNAIVARFKKTCGVDFLTRFQGYVDGNFGDFTDVVDYRTAIEQIRKADETFMNLPAQVRANFLNDPAQFLDFVQNPANVDELVKMGLATKPEGSNIPVPSAG